MFAVGPSDGSLSKLWQLQTFGAKINVAMVFNSSFITGCIVINDVTQLNIMGVANDRVVTGLQDECIGKDGLGWKHQDQLNVSVERTRVMAA